MSGSPKEKLQTQGAEEVHDEREVYLRDGRKLVVTEQAGDQLVEPLTDRELAVLDHLPTRESNADMAQALYVSVNTLKTHLRNIYRKLDAGGRDEAIDRARELHLL